ncbi:DUF1574 family protein [Leptospira perolatii]|uniref:DUF1574 family protein n=1 Tax=Leptospira perolatii TaxID=2023191 RepID=UPI0013FE1787|nr:DUF1574 family protein [Leptospira perolatii]
MNSARKKYNFAFWLPLLVFLVFFLLDKLLLIPRVRLIATEYQPASSAVKEIAEDWEPKSSKLVQGEKVFWAFGTSRSRNFDLFPNPEYTKKDPFLNHWEKESLKNWEGVGVAVNAATMQLLHIRLLQILDRGIQPELVFFEISPMSFNSNHAYNDYFKQDVVPFHLLWKHRSDLGYKPLVDWLLPVLFSSYRFKFSPRTAWRTITGNRIQGEVDFLDALEKNNSASKDALSKADRPSIESPKFEDDKNPTFSLGEKYGLWYEYFTKSEEKKYFANYRVDPEQVEYLEKTIRLLQSRKIKTIYWRPKIHSEFLKLENRTEIQKQLELSVYPLFKKYGIRLVDANQVSMACDYFKDASHLSARCYTSLTAKLLENGL